MSVAEYQQMLMESQKRFFYELYTIARGDGFDYNNLDIIITKIKKLAFEEKMISIVFSLAPKDLAPSHDYFHKGFFNFLRFINYASTYEFKEFFTKGKAMFLYADYAKLVERLKVSVPLESSSLCNNL
jgi:hypothetical protein